MKKFKYRLSQFENAVVASEHYTLTKINKAYCLLESLGQEWEKALEAKRKSLLENDNIMTPPDLVSVMVELSKKYHELENLSNKEMLENTIDAFMLKMEELDGKISDVLGRADKMRERVEEKLYEVAGAANEHIDKLKAAMTFGTKRLLLYDELPAPWQNNKVREKQSPLFDDNNIFYSTSCPVIAFWIQPLIVGIHYSMYTMKPAIFGHIYWDLSSCSASAFTNCSIPN
jgi:adiponectin receptor